MRPLLPSLKEKKRYIVFEVLSDTPVTASETYNVIEQSLNNYVGTKGMAEAGLQFMKKKWNTKKQRGIARVNHTSADTLKASFVFIKKMKNKNITIHSIGTSGILDKAVKKYIIGGVNKK
jgi:ribonuclease P/MRP protein subunit POP5